MDSYFKPQVKTHRLRHRAVGSPQEYWTLELILDGKVVNIFTSKNLNYIKAHMKGWETPGEPTA